MKKLLLSCVLVFSAQACLAMAPYLQGTKLAPADLSQQLTLVEKKLTGEYIYENFLDSKLLQQAIVLFSNAQVGFTLETKDELFQSGYAREYMERRQIKDTQANPELARFFEKRNQAGRTGSCDRRFPETEVVRLA